MMKDFCISLALIGAIALSTQGAFAAWEGMQTLNPMPYISYLNPLPYIGIGENKTNFSLNPFAGFKNCNKCKVKRTACNDCKKVSLCPTCQRAIEQPKCNSCDRIYIQPVIQPRCTSCGH